MLDPRRPNRKVTAEEQEENLIQYVPFLHEDPRRVLSHEYQVGLDHAAVTVSLLTLVITGCQHYTNFDGPVFA
jgi:ER membrane protein complex subunit 1